MKKFNIFIVLVILALFIVSCATDIDSVREETKGWDATRMYDRASSELAKNNLNHAINLYQVLETTYPYGRYSQIGLLDLAYAYYKNNKEDEALKTIDEFINTYPTNSGIDYALYLKGYIYYKHDDDFLSDLTNQDLSERDPESLDKAYATFYQLATLYPNSKFAYDARQKIIMIVNSLARGELYHARYYMNIKAYIAAIDRAQNVITKYSHTPYVEEALAIQVLAYQKLAKPTLSDGVKKVLALNFPSSIFLKKSWSYRGVKWFSI